MKIAVGCGSRGVANIAECTKTVVDQLKSLGANPFIFPAMGSHGSATADGQRRFLRVWNNRAAHWLSDCF